MADVEDIDASSSTTAHIDVVPGADLDSRVIHEKLTSAFSNVTWSSHLYGLIQFWAPVETTTRTKCGRRRRVLSTCNQPFIIEENKLYSWFHNYRLHCLTFSFSIDDRDHDNVNLNRNNNQMQNVIVDHNPMILITNCGPDIAFLNHLPSLLNLNSPLQCLRRLLLPLFYYSSCVGVIECSMMKSSSPSVIFKYLKSALERVGLTTFHIQEYPLYKTVRNHKHVTDELEKALEIVHVSHGLTLSQIWITSKNENPVPFSSNTQTKPKFAVRLKGYCADSHPPFIKDYYDTCDMIPFKMGEKIAGKTLKSYEPHFSTNINGSNANWHTKISCFAICLRSTNDVDVDYVFEFFWAISRNYLIMLESLILTLKSCLPSFKLPSGAQLGDELRVLDVDKSTGSGSEYFTILQGNRFSQIPKATLEQGSGSMTEDCQSSTVVRCKKTSIRTEVRQGPTFVKRKLSNLSNSQVDSNREYKRAKQEHSANSNSTETSPDKYDQVIIAEYKEKKSFFLLSVTMKLAKFRKKIEEKFNLVSETYRLEYLFEEKWVMLNDDEDMTNCAILLKSFRSKIRVLQSAS